ncbi:hypothetical protein M0R45_011093 [Rubus argutus]|uniref:Uncharacterized protein n=1 Tax=Rubus argutus TaxID=59490 RepID=A0AAW1YBZ0_RUBAR
MKTPLNQNNDLEAGASPLLYPSMTENAELRWGFIRKVYAILTAQLLLTIPVAATVYLVPPIAVFLVETWLGWALKHMIIITSLVVLFAMFVYSKQHPLNYMLLGAFTICEALMVGLSCAFTSGKVILEAAILTAVIFLCLTLYTFWAARRGHDFNFLGPFLFSSLVALVVFGVIQIVLPLGKMTHMIYGIVGILVFCGYIVHDTDELIKRYEYDEYILAAIDLYLDILNLFLKLVEVMKDAESSDNA